MPWGSWVNPSGGSSEPPDLSPDPSGTYAYPSEVVVDGQGRVTDITAGAAPTGLTIRTVTVAPLSNEDLPGTDFDSGRVVGYARFVNTVGGAVSGSGVLSCIWFGGSSVDTTGDTTGLAFSTNGGLLNVELTTNPGYSIVLRYYVVEEEA